MSGIIGIFKRDGFPVKTLVSPSSQQKIKSEGVYGYNLWNAGSVRLGQALFFNKKDQTHFERFPFIDTECGIVFIVEARLDNRNELISECGLQRISSTISDRELVFCVYRRWKEKAPSRILGDWSFAAWHITERKLFLARDHLGMTSLYYYLNEKIFAFSSSRNTLLALNIVPLEIDELHLAKVLTISPGYDDHTNHKYIKSLLPAHTITLTSAHSKLDCYWRMENISELRLRKKEDYIHRFKILFDHAVETRLKSREEEEEKQQGFNEPEIAATLSGGLDSGSVVVTAAQILIKKGNRIKAFTSIPIYETDKYIDPQEWVGNELKLAQATARKAKNVDLYPITSLDLSPIQAIRQALFILNEPGPFACNLFWLLAMRKSAQAHKCKILLHGTMGNYGISWNGSPFSQSILFQMRHFGIKQYIKESIKRYVPTSLLASYRNIRLAKSNWWQFSAIHPDFATRIKLLDHMINSPYSAFSSASPEPLKQRLGYILSSDLGAIPTEISAFYGMESRDPTADIRLLEFILSVPDHIFIDPNTGLDRWLIREAMKDRLPEEVRLNHRKSYQYADIVPRLRASSLEVENTLNELQQGAASAYLDVSYLYKIWDMIKYKDNMETLSKAGNIFTLGIMTGLWVNNFYNGNNINSYPEFNLARS